MFWKPNLAHSKTSTLHNIATIVYLCLPEDRILQEGRPCSNWFEATDTLTLFGVGQEVHDRQELRKFDELITPWAWQMFDKRLDGIYFWQMKNPHNFQTDDNSIISQCGIHIAFNHCPCLALEFSIHAIRNDSRWFTMHYFPVMLLRLLQVWAELLDHTVAICVEEICEPCGATGLTQCVHRMHSHPLIPQAHATLVGVSASSQILGPAHLPARLLNMKQPACGISLQSFALHVPDQMPNENHKQHSCRQSISTWRAQLAIPSRKPIWSNWSCI